VDWVVARSLCYYRRFDLSGLSPGDRAQALEVQIAQWAPLSDYTSYVAWRQGRAQVWLWPRAAVEQARRDLGVRVRRVLPETALRAPAESGGGRLVAAWEGYEAQAWSEDGELAQSRWWPEPPALADWQYFARAAGQGAASAPPAPEEVPLQEQPWALDRRGRGEVAAEWERRGLVAATAAFLLLMGMLSTRLVLWEQATARLQTDLSRLEEQSSRVLDARATALRLRGRAQELARLAPPLAQTRLLADVVDAMPDSGFSLLKWRYASGELEFVVKSDQADPRYYVKALRELPYATDVRATRGQARDQLQINLRVK
jgi:hypothetical protein